MIASFSAKNKANFNFQSFFQFEVGSNLEEILFFVVFLLFRKSVLLPSELKSLCRRIFTRRLSFRIGTFNHFSRIHFNIRLSAHILFKIRVFIVAYKYLPDVRNTYISFCLLSTQFRNGSCFLLGHYPLIEPSALNSGSFSR